MQAGASTAERRPRDHRVGLAGLILVLALGAVALYLAAGLPKPPDSLPDWTIIQLTLRGSELPLAAAAYILTTAAWLIWCWVTLSLVLRLIVGVADARTGGAVWVRGPHTRGGEPVMDTGKRSCVSWSPHAWG